MDINAITSHIQTSADTVATLNAEDIHTAITLIVAAYQAGNKMLLAGNGGSAADAQHIAAELVGRYKEDRPAIAALALTTNTSSLTSIANDYGYGSSISRQVEAFGVEGDIFVAISTSGNSKNICEAAKVAKEMGLIVIGLAGENGGQLRDSCDHCICVPSSDTPRIQECHILIGHILCDGIESALNS